MLFFIAFADLSADEQDFVRCIYEKYGSYMYREAYRILRNPYDAEDAVSDAMLKIIKFLAKFEGNTDTEIRNKIVIGIRSIIRRKAIDCYNANKKKLLNEADLTLYDDGRESYETEPEDTAANIEQLMLTKDLQKAVEKALLQLPVDLQDAVNLVYFSGFTQVEAADYLGIKDSTVRKRIFTARKKLANLLGEEQHEK